MYKRKGRAQGVAQHVAYAPWTDACEEAYQQMTARQRRTLVWAAVKQAPGPASPPAAQPGASKHRLLASWQARSRLR